MLGNVEDYQLVREEISVARSARGGAFDPGCIILIIKYVDIHSRKQ